MTSEFRLAACLPAPHRAGCGRVYVLRVRELAILRILALDARSYVERSRILLLFVKARGLGFTAKLTQINAIAALPARECLNYVSHESTTRRWARLRAGLSMPQLGMHGIFYALPHPI